MQDTTLVDDSGDIGRPMKLEGKVAVVTGSGRGIGRAIAEMFAREGAKVVVTARTEREIEDVAERIRTLGGEAISVQTDVAKDDDVVRLVKRTISAFGQLDVLVNNAAANHPPTKVVDMTAETWRQVIDVNLDGPFLCAHAALPHMIERKTGKIINISSIGGRQGGRGRGAYRASKAALIRFTETLAAEVYEHGIRVNCICPGGVETEMMRQITQGNVPSNLMHPDEIAKVALFLASDDGSAITGTAVDAFGASNPLFQSAWRAPRR